METWFLILISFSIIILFKSIFNRLRPSIPKLPPGPTPLPFIGNLLLIRKSSFKFDSFIRNLHAQYGPIITLYFCSRPVIFISKHSLAHQVLVQHGAVVSNRPPAAITAKTLFSNQITIFAAFYGPNWNLLRRNLISEIFHPSRLKSLSNARNSALENLIKSLTSQSESEGYVRFLEQFRLTMMDLSVFMCFGFNLEEKQTNELSDLFHRVLLYASTYNKLNFYPLKLGKILFPNLWKELLQLRKEKEAALIPLIRRRQNEKQIKNHRNEIETVLPYIDTLPDLNLPEKNRKLEEGEIVSLCSEFLNGVVHTTVVVMQWTMANLVKYPEIQEKLYNEISQIIGSKGKVTEDDLKKLPYLKAVIYESLRRHPPGHFVLAHAVTEQIMLGDYLVPKNASVNFMVSEMGWDSEVWGDEAMEFKPERFLSNEEDEVGVEEFDITGSREIKMMPFGAGRRICPGLGLAMLHLQYFVANLVWVFKWSAVDEVDLEEKLEVSLNMKNPLKAHLSLRSTDHFFG